MSSGAIEKLYFSIGLIDKLSGPSKGVAKSIQKIHQTARSGIIDFAKGGGAIGGMAFSMLKATDPARGFSKALGEVASLDVSPDELNKLGQASKQFAMQFGGDATEIAKSAYDIQSSIPGLAKGALAAFTYQGALLAKAGKSNSDTITKYMGAMYNVFQEDAKKVGQAKWVDQLTGKTAYAIKMFRTTGNEMSAAFTNLGSVGKVNGVSMDEQMAVLGVLQGTMGGANAGTAYKSFLNKISQAEKALGMKFTDTAGKALPMVDVLEKIKAKLGPAGLTAADSGKLMLAFGEEGGKALVNLMDKVDQLKSATGDLSKVNDSSGAATMAAKMVDPLDKLTGTGQVLAITFGQILLPGVNMVLDAMSAFGRTVNWLLEVCPPLRWVIAALTAVIVTLTIAWGTMKIVMGAGKLWQALVMKITLVNNALVAMKVVTREMTFTQKLAAIWNWIWQGSIKGVSYAANFLRLNLIWNKAVMLASVVWAQLVAIAQGAMALGFWGSCAAVWSFTVALLACPITWIVVGIAALIAAIVACIYYWDEISAFVVKYADYLLMMLGPIGLVIAAFRNWDKITAWLGNVWGAFKNICPNIANLLEKLFALWWSGVTGIWSFWKDVWNNIGSFFSNIWGGIIDDISNKLLWVGNFISSIWNGMFDKFNAITEWLSGKLVPAIQMISSLFSWLGGLGTDLWGRIVNIFSGMDGWVGKILRTLSNIPGLGFLNPDVTTDQAKVKQPTVPSVAAARKTDVSAGGVRNNTNNKVNNYGGVTINTTAPVGPGEMEELFAMQGV